jgi:predicted alpha/beta-fold hydrolase
VPLAHVDQALGASNIEAPWWLPGGHLQTIWPAVHARHLSAQALSVVTYRRERWTTPDGDFIDLDWQDAPASPTLEPGALKPHKPHLLVLFHGLEGSSSSHYALAFARQARRYGLDFVVPHFRGCSGELNLAPRAYHSGDFEEIGWILERLRQRTTRPLLAVGVSLGGNALLRWAQEAGAMAVQTASAVASVSAPVDLAASGQAIGRGFNRQVYTRMFLRSMKPKALKKLTQHPGLFNADTLRSARTLYDFDNVFTAPLHGFKNTDDYWRRASAKPHLQSIQIPALVVNALNDPFVPAHSLPKARSAHALAHAVPLTPFVTLWQPPHGGHVGFASGAWPGHINALPEAVINWLAQQSGLQLTEPAHG